MGRDLVKKYLTNKLWREKNKEKIARRIKLWHQSHREHRKNYQKAYYKTHQKVLSERLKKSRDNPEYRLKNMARSRVFRAIKSGKIKRAICSIKKCKIIGQAHHPDYNKPLEIVWLCNRHHQQLHHSNI
jgi:hypothetical protein